MGWETGKACETHKVIYERGVHINVPEVQASSMLSDYTEFPNFPDFIVAYHLIGIASAVVKGDGILVQAFS